MNYKRELAYPISPKSGPLPPMTTLQDASRAITAFLPREVLRRPHWLRAGNAVLHARRAEPASEVLIVAATEAVVAALDAEEWMTHARRVAAARQRRVMIASGNQQAPPVAPAGLEGGTPTRPSES
jgi:uncharacterized membrane protein